MSDISEIYEAQYPAAEDHGKRLAMEFDGDVQGLRDMVTALRSTITGMSGEEKKARDVKMPRMPAARAVEAAIQLIVCATARDVALSDVQCMGAIGPGSTLEVRHPW